MTVVNLGPPLGREYSSSVYRDTFRLRHNSTNTDALVDELIVAKATVDAAIAAARDGTVNGYVLMGPADCLRISFLGAGADNSTFNYRVSGLCPIIEKGTDGQFATVAYAKTFMWQGVATLGTGTIGSVADAVAGIETTDRWADALTSTVAGGAILNPPGDSRVTSVLQGSSPAPPANLKVAMLGCPVAQIETDLVDATAARAIVKRAAGVAFPGKGGGG